MQMSSFNWRPVQEIGVSFNFGSLYGVEFTNKRRLPLWKPTKNMIE